MFNLIKRLTSKNAHDINTNINFVIFGAMRSGSNLLQEKLNYFDDLICLGELYNPAFVGVDRPHIDKFNFAGYGRNNPESRKQRQDDPFLLLEKIADTAHNRDKIVGFRIFDGHNKSVRRVLLNDTRVKKIILHRNLIDSFVSLELARQSGQWVKKDDNTPKLRSINFSINDFEAYVKGSQQFFGAVIERLDKTKQEYMIVSYDDVLNDAQVAKIAKFVGSQSEMKKVETQLKKQNSSKLSDKINNFDDVKEYLSKFNQTVFG